MKIFISSTYKDLIEYRKKAIEVSLRHKCLPLAMEFFNAQTEDATTVCYKEIRECDIFIGIYAHRYGYIPDGGTKSITHLEYELAKKEGKNCLCFIMDKTFKRPDAFVEMDEYPKLEALLEDVRKTHVVEFFKNPDDLGLKLSSSLVKYIKKGTCYIPRAPFPYMAHPYALPEHFTGRKAEMAMLSNWFFNDKEPVLVLEAIGGMGKSALSWAWLKKEIIKSAEKVDGVFWWSFYDEPFETFIKQLYCYVTGKEATQSFHLDELQAAFNHRRFFLALDGLERALRGYAGMEAMFIQEKRFDGDTHAEAEWDKRMREPVHPLAGRFLQALCAGNTKVLITTRLTPVSLEGLSGIKHISLKGLSAEDTVNFLRSEGINGTRAEMEQAANVYEFHPLMLKLLASAIKRSRAKDIKEAFSQNLIDQKEPHKILDRSVLLLSKEEQRVAVRAAVFRGIFTFDAVKAVAHEVEEKRLWQVLMELRDLGFLFYDESRDRFDFHPILRSFLYRKLTSAEGTGVHDLAAQYFRALPNPEKVVSLDDLTPVIEFYHHLVKAGKYDEALELFYERINNPTYYQLAAFQLQIELLKELFPNPESADISERRKSDGKLPLLKKEEDQAWTLNALANSYALSGQPANAMPLYLLHNKLREEEGDKKNLAIGLENAVLMAQVYLGQFSAAAGHLRKSIHLCREIKDESNEAVGRQELARVLTYQGRTAATDRISLNPSLSGSLCAEAELDIAFKLFEKNSDVQSLSGVSVYRSLSMILPMRLDAVLQRNKKFSLEISHYARQALTFAEEYTKNHSPTPRDFVRAYWSLGEALCRCGNYRSFGFKHSETIGFDISFYDEYFQQVVETLTITAAVDSELNAAGRCLHEALRRCRKSNMVYHEPGILLGLERLNFAKNNPPDETLLKETMEIAIRSGYRLILTDLHLFCGQVLLQFKNMKSLLGFTAVEHLQKAKEYALDVSDISHLYSPIKFYADDFYKDIPEYNMLKRGMNDEERIRNGYWISYTIADTLLNESR